MDVHRNVEANESEIATAHERDIEVQSNHGVKYCNYWVDDREGAVFCLFEAPSKEAGEAVHREAHGLVADEIFEVREGV